MNIMVAVDDNGGMLFNGRRQSQDSALREYLLNITKDDVLWMNQYSLRQFETVPPNVRISEDFLSEAGSGEYCFVEDKNIAEVSDKLEMLILFRWNRSYPSDMKLDYDPLSNGMRMQKTENIVGQAHEKITVEVWGT